MMELITEKTTLEEFTSEDNWVIEDTKTGAVYQMRIAMLDDGQYYLYVIQSGADNIPSYARYLHTRAVIITSRVSLLSIVQSKRFYIDYR